MTSKISFTKLCVENMKRKLWLLVITVLTYFVCMPIAMLLELQSQARYEPTERVYLRIFSDFLGMGFNSVFAAGFGILCALAGFAWLFSKKKVDLYHSIPVKREKMFFSIWLNGIIFWLVPYVVSILICLGIISSYLTLDGSLIALMLETLGINILFFMFFYHLAILAVMLTGNMINCFATGAVLFGYVTAIRLLLESYLEVFIATYYAYSDFMEELKFSSPIMTFVYLADRFVSWQNNRQYYANNTELVMYLAQCLVITLIIGVIAVTLYKKRPSEAAGRSIAFEKIMNIYRILLVIPLALGSGLLFTALVDGSSTETAWLIFGLIFGLVLSHGFIEVLFQMDIKAMFSYKKQLFATGVVVFLLAFSMKQDWYGINKWMPEKEEVSSMAVTAGVMDGGYFYYYNKEQGEQLYGQDWVLKNMVLTDTELAYGLAKDGMECVVESQKYPEQNFNSGISYERYVVKYRLKNGKERTKRYWLPEDAVYEYVSQLYQDEAYKNVIMNLLWEEGKTATRLHLSDASYTEQELAAQWIPEFIEIYHREYDALTYKDMQESCVAAEIDIEHYRDGEYLGRAGDFPLYSCCEESLRYLEEKGIDISYMAGDFEGKIQQLGVALNGEVVLQRLGLSEESMSEEYEKNGELSIRNEKTIEMLLPYLRFDKWPYRYGTGYDEDFHIYVTMKDGDDTIIFPVNLLIGSPIEEIVKEEWEKIS